MLAAAHGKISCMQYSQLLFDLDFQIFFWVWFKEICTPIFTLTAEEMKSRDVDDVEANQRCTVATIVLADV